MAKKSRRKRTQTKKRKVNDGGMSLSDIKKMYDITQDFKWSTHCVDDKEFEEIGSWYIERKLKYRRPGFWVAVWLSEGMWILFWICMMLSEEGIAHPIGTFVVTVGGSALVWACVYYNWVLRYEKQMRKLNYDCVREAVLDKMCWHKGRSYGNWIVHYAWVWNEDKNKFYRKELWILGKYGWYDRYWYPGQIMYYVEGAVELIPKAGINNAAKVVIDLR